MDRIQELLSRITSLSDDELNELRDLILQQFDEENQEDTSDAGTEGTEDASGSGDSSDSGAMDDGSGDSSGFSVAAPTAPSPERIAMLSELADASEALAAEFARREEARAVSERVAAAKTALSSSSLNAGLQADAESAGAGDGEGASSEGASDAGGEGGAADAEGQSQEGSTSSDAASGDAVASSEGATAEAGAVEDATGVDETVDGPGGAAPETDGAAGTSQSQEGGGDAVNASSDTSIAKPPQDRQPKATSNTTCTVVAGVDLPGISVGTEFTNAHQLAEAMTARIHSLSRMKGDGEQMIVASAKIEFPEDRMLRASDGETNYQKMVNVMSPKAITAAGGTSAPLEVYYDLFGAGVQDRPVRDALTRFGADRGGIRFVRPPTLDNLAGAVSVWTLQNDVDAASNSGIRKPSVRVDAGQEVTVHTQAIPLILTFGNMQARAYPEMVARHNELGLIAHCRTAEQQLLTQIGALSVAVSGPATQQLGAAREIFPLIDRAAAAHRNRHRLGTMSLRAIFPLWFKDELRSDLAMQMPGGQTDLNLAISDAQIDGWFTDRNINVTWALEGEAGQDYSALVPGGIADYPDEVIWYLFAEGTFLFLDGGVLDLGIVRDSTLNAANDYQMFVESFEAVARVGYDSLRVTTAVKPTGASSAAVVYTAP